LPSGRLSARPRSAQSSTVPEGNKWQPLSLQARPAS
jgi:hypothetical protein